MVYTTAYVSTLTTELTRTQLADLLQASRSNNVEAGISGLLIVRGLRVMQLLEGDEDAVRALFHRISADPRHSDVVTVWSSSGPNRRFPTWSMGFDDLDTLDELPTVDRLLPARP